MVRPLLCSKAMGKLTLLSAEISRGRALLAGGASGHEILLALKQWVLRMPMRGPRRPNPSLFRWNDRLCGAIQEALPLGGPVGQLLREVQPMIRREEKHWVKQQAVERQFGFQGAIAMVLPWGVASLSGGIELNIMTASGAVFQALGLGAFYLIIHRASRPVAREQAWLFEYLVAAWMRVRAGLSLFAGLEAALRGSEVSAYRQAWQRWLKAHEGGATELEAFAWPASMEQSPELGRLLHALLKTGAPAAETLADLINQLDDERQAEFEERIGTLPTRLSLAFCALLTPAVFLVLLGSLWPSLQSLPL